MLNMKVATRESLRLGLLTSTPGPPLSSLSPVLYLQLPFSTCLTLPTPASTISLPIQHPPEALHNPPLLTTTAKGILLSRPCLSRRCPIPWP